MENSVRQSVLDHLRAFSTPERPVYLVGGAVRDLLLNRPVHDLDFVLAGGTRKLANELACRMDGALYVLDDARDTTRVVLDLGGHKRMLVDFAALREADLEGDLRARDFTINAMAYDIAHPDQLIDPLDGAADLLEKRLRACAPTSLQDDPIRVLRAVRLAVGLQFRIQPETFDQVRKAAAMLARISPERQRDELMRILEGSQVVLALRLLDKAGALRPIMPELEALKGIIQPAPHVEDAWEHTLSVVRYLEQLLPPLLGSYQPESVADLTVGSAVQWLGRFRARFEDHYRQALVPDRSPRALLFLSALYHDIAKPATRSLSPGGRIRFFGHDTQGAAVAGHRARALALSSAEVERVSTIIEHHMRIHQLSGALSQKSPTDAEGKISRRSIYRFFKDAKEAGIDICLLSLADMRGTYGVTLPQPLWEAELETCRTLLEAFWEKSDEVVSPPRLLTGGDIIHTMQLSPGPVIGKILDAVREAQAAGEVHDREEALQFARRWLEKKPGIEEVSREEMED